MNKDQSARDFNRFSDPVKMMEALARSWGASEETAKICAKLILADMPAKPHTEEQTETSYVSAS